MNKLIWWIPIQIISAATLLATVVIISDKLGITDVQPLLINISDSIPRGIYVRTFVETIRRGSIVAFPMPTAMQNYIAPYPEWFAFFVSHRLIKPVVAIAGDAICRDGDTNIVTVNGMELGIAQTKGKDGRSLPSWSGCKVLGADEIAVASDRIPDSLDSKIFGPVPASTARIYRPLLVSK